jgi:hypothetical protein
VVTPARTLIVTSAVWIVTALLLLMVGQAASRPAHAASDRLPDLGMARFKALQTQRANDGRRLLRFSSIIVNVGAGRFEARGWRPGTATNTMRVKQRIYNDAGAPVTLAAVLSCTLRAAGTAMTDTTIGTYATCKKSS